MTFTTHSILTEYADDATRRADAGMTHSERSAAARASRLLTEIAGQLERKAAAAARRAQKARDKRKGRTVASQTADCDSQARNTRRSGETWERSGKASERQLVLRRVDAE